MQTLIQTLNGECQLEDSDFQPFAAPAHSFILKNAALSTQMSFLFVTLIINIDKKPEYGANFIHFFFHLFFFFFFYVV